MISLADETEILGKGVSVNWDLDKGDLCLTLFGVGVIVTMWILIFQQI